MKALTLFSSTPPTITTKPFTWQPKTPHTYLKTTSTSTSSPPHPPNSTKLYATAKGFTGSSSSPPSTIKDTTSAKQNTSQNNNNDNRGDEDQIPEAVFERIILRILAFVGVPLGLGLGFLHVFGIVKERQLWDVPLWLPFTTTLVCFGASTLGIAYGALSTSWDVEKKGSVLGLEEARKNWVEIWKDED